MDSTAVAATEHRVPYLQVRTQSQNWQDRTAVDFYHARWHSARAHETIVRVLKSRHHRYFHDAGLPVYQLRIQLPRRTVQNRSRLPICNKSFTILPIIPRLRNVYTIMSCGARLRVCGFHDVPTKERSVSGGAARL